jgi:glycosyltransferase involved in cell wall biosynthesis
MEKNHHDAHCDCASGVHVVKPKVALVHDWLTGMRGGERCLEVFCELFPNADLYTLIHRRGTVSPTIERMAIHTSILQHIPLAKTHYRHLLPILPLAIKQFGMTDYDLILSSSHAVVKGVRRSGSPLHVCYCFTPMRYIWDQSHIYFPRERFSPVAWALLQALFRYLRAWDVKSSSGVDEFVAISNHIAAKIQAYYNRKAHVISPPVDCGFFTPKSSLQQHDSSFYLIVSALVPYKRVDIGVEAFNRLRLPLVVIGVGPERSRLERRASSYITFLGWQPDAMVRDYYRRCEALIFPGEEDFGIVPLEAQACGKPVIAFGKGGALETVIPLNGTSPEATSSRPPTGVFFYDPTVEALCEAVLTSRRWATAFELEAIRQNALCFDRLVFKDRIKTFLGDRMGITIP